MDAISELNAKNETPTPKKAPTKSGKAQARKNSKTTGKRKGSHVNSSKEELRGGRPPQPPRMPLPRPFSRAVMTRMRVVHIMVFVPARWGT